MNKGWSGKKQDVDVILYYAHLFTKSTCACAASRVKDGPPTSRGCSHSNRSTSKIATPKTLTARAPGTVQLFDSRTRPALNRDNVRTWYSHFPAPESIVSTFAPVGPGMAADRRKCTQALLWKPESGVRVLVGEGGLREDSWSLRAPPPEAPSGTSTPRRFVLKFKPQRFKVLLVGKTLTTSIQN